MLFIQNIVFMGASYWDPVNATKNKVWNMCVRFIATGFHQFLFFLIDTRRVLQTISSNLTC